MKNKAGMELLPYSGEIHFNNIDSTTIVKHKTALRKWVNTTIKKEGFVLGEISYNFCSDNTLLEINKQHLNHDFYTDIITFDLNESNYIIGDIYISTERVKENAKTQQTTYTNELHRVLVHGILHLCGYKDKTKKEATTMREKEDYYLSLLGSQQA
jgi:probable rRNA maturation factor